MGRGRPRNTITNVLHRVDQSGGPDACWPWLGYKNKRGYGVTSVGGSSRMVHRFVYENLVGLIPTGITVDHLCFNPDCQNPRHMVLLTRSENAKRRKTVVSNVCSRGHDLTATASRTTGRRYCIECNRLTIAERRERVAAGESFKPIRACARGHEAAAMRQRSDGYWHCIECKRITQAARRAKVT